MLHLFTALQIVRVVTTLTEKVYTRLTVFSPRNGTSLFIIARIRVIRLALYLFEHTEWCLSFATLASALFVTDIHLVAPPLNSHSSSQNENFAQTSTQLRALNKT